MKGTPRLREQYGELISLSSRGAVVARTEGRSRTALKGEWGLNLEILAKTRVFILSEMGNQWSDLDKGDT